MTSSNTPNPDREESNAAVNTTRRRFHIIYEVGPTIVVDKQPGVLTQAPAGVDSIEFRVKEYMNLSTGQVGKRYLGLPHRLDRPASGALAFTKNARAARRMSEQFEEHTVTKKYWALVDGVVQEDSGYWYDYMRKIPGIPKAEIVSPILPDAREAILHFKVIKRYPDTTWLEIQLETGRTHQIRLQCASRGFPLLGDALYGSTRPFGPQYEDERERAIALHSRELTFIDYTTRKETRIVAPLYSIWKDWTQIPGEKYLEEMYLKAKPFTTDIFGTERKSATHSVDN